MTLDEIEKEIKRINSEMDFIREKISKGPRFFSIVFCGIASFVLTIGGMIVLLLHSQELIFIILAITLFSFALVFLAFILKGIRLLEKSKHYSEKYEELKNEKKELLEIRKQQIYQSSVDDEIQDKQSKFAAKEQNNESESEEDMLLRLLSEGKITIEEYKTLSKKK